MTQIEAVGLRERKKAATRLALHEAALRLSVERGLDAVTVDAIADAANVSRRTFSHYFTSKEDALLHGDRVRLERLIEAYRARPADEPAWRALTAAALEFYGEQSELDPTWVTQLRLVKRHPALAARQIAFQADRETALVSEIMRRLPDGPDLEMRARVIAGVYLAGLRAAYRAWLDQEARVPLVDAIALALRYAGGSFV